MKMFHRYTVTAYLKCLLLSASCIGLPCIQHSLEISGRKWYEIYFGIQWYKITIYFNPFKIQSIVS